ncbi:MAG: hypothetical protein A3H44_09710 [Gammaproteobacteria bacterium RIFCSPLOWO2_02_FULL_57_10]|nr:MAG: hypothetical protein A3H44_09710 [Gammaproteobacteria bacterium RIFCSPLOWO2_02_FULL_57_10]
MVANGEGWPPGASPASSMGAPALGQDADDLRAMAQTQLSTLTPVTQSEIASPVVDLGRKLFWDMRLSSDGNTACTSSHYQQA